MRSRLMAAAVGAALTLTGAGAAHAAAPPGPPTIFILDTLRDTENGTHFVSTTCDNNGHALIHTILYNDDGGPEETVVVFMDTHLGDNDLGTQVQNTQQTPIDIPVGANVAVTLPYGNGSAAFDAVAVAKGSPLPATMNELEADAAADAADNSWLFAPGAGIDGTYEYRAAPKECAPTSPQPTAPSSTPSATPTAAPTTDATTRPPESAPSTIHSTTVTLPPTTTRPLPTITGSTAKPTQHPATVATSGASSSFVVEAATTSAVLATTSHRSVSPLIWTALVLALAGGIFVFEGIRRGRRRH